MISYLHSNLSTLFKYYQEESYVIWSDTSEPKVPHSPHTHTFSSYKFSLMLRPPLLLQRWTFTHLVPVDTLLSGQCIYVTFDTLFGSFDPTPVRFCPALVAFHRNPLLTCGWTFMLQQILPCGRSRAEQRCYNWPVNTHTHRQTRGHKLRRVTSAGCHMFIGNKDFPVFGKWSAS